MRPAEAPTEGFWAALGRKWAESREKAAQKAAARAAKRLRYSEQRLVENYAEVVKTHEDVKAQWSAMHYDSKEYHGPSKRDLEPISKKLQRSMDKLCRLHDMVPVSSLSYEQAKVEKQTLIDARKYSDTNSLHLPPNHRNKDLISWDEVDKSVFHPREDALTAFIMAPEHADLRLADKQRREQQATREWNERYEAQQAEWDEAKHLEQTRDDYVDATLPLIQRARKDPAFAARITRWGIDLDRPDREAARDDTWRRLSRIGRGDEGRLVWAIVTDEAKEADRKAAQSLSKALDEHTDLKRPLSGHNPKPQTPRPNPAPKAEPPNPKPTTVKPTTAPKPSGGGDISGP